MAAAFALATIAGTMACGLALGAAGRWTPVAEPPQPIPPSASILTLPDGRIVVLGGFTIATGEPATETLVFDPRAGTWAQGSPIPEPRLAPLVIATQDGRVLVAGGVRPCTATQCDAGTFTSAWIFDPVAGSWHATGHLINARSGANAALLSDGRVLVAGGTISSLSTDPSQPNFSTVLDAEVFDPGSGKWASAGVQGRDGEVLVALPRGKALAAGGCIQPPANSFGVAASALAAAEEFDGARWVSVNPMPAARCNARGVALADGGVLVVGGFDAAGPVADAVSFDSQSGTWTPAGRPNVSGGDATPSVVALADGRVFLAGVQAGQRVGGRSTLLLGGQIYDPKTGDWAFVTTTSMVTTASPFGSSGIAGIAPAPPDGALVLLERAALSFDTRASPPAVSVLDSTGLTWLLVALVGALLASLVATRTRSG